MRRKQRGREQRTSGTGRLPDPRQQGVFCGSKASDDSPIGDWYWQFPGTSWNTDNVAVRVLQRLSVGRRPRDDMEVDGNYQMFGQNSPYGMMNKGPTIRCHPTGSLRTAGRRPQGRRQGKELGGQILFWPMECRAGEVRQRDPQGTAVGIQQRKSRQRGSN